jgi:hypothetical protein
MSQAQRLCGELTSIRATRRVSEVLEAKVSLGEQVRLGARGWLQGVPPMRTGMQQVPGQG